MLGIGLLQSRTKKGTHIAAGFRSGIEIELGHASCSRTLHRRREPFMRSRFENHEDIQRGGAGAGVHISDL